MISGLPFALLLQKILLISGNPDKTSELQVKNLKVIRFWISSVSVASEQNHFSLMKLSHMYFIIEMIILH